MATYTDTNTDLIINRMTRQVYNELCASGEIYDDELYLIEDECFDVFNKRIVNVEPPIGITDAVNLDYLSTNYVLNTEVINYIDNSKIYSSKRNQYWENGETYICRDKKVYVKDTSKWNIQILQGNLTLDRIKVKWSDGLGWQFVIDDSFNVGQNIIPNLDTMTEEFDYQGTHHKLTATSWNYKDTLIGKKEIYSCLSNLNESSEQNDILQSLLKLKNYVNN